MLNLKKTLHAALEANDPGSVVSLAMKDRKVVSQLVRLAYDKETLVGWRAIKAIGLVAREIAGTDHEFLRGTVRKLLWTVSDESGGIGWSAPEIVGEIVSADPDNFRDIVPLLTELYDIEETVFRPGVLYALGRIAQANADIVEPYRDIIVRGLTDDVPLVRIHALELVRIFWPRMNTEDRKKLRPALQALSRDMAEVWLFKGSEFVNIQIRDAAISLDIEA